MKLEIPFDENIYSEQTTLYFNQFWNKNLKKNKERIYWAIPLTIVGIFLVKKENNLGFFSLGIGIHYLINFYTYYRHYKTIKTKHFELTNSEIDGQKSAGQNTILEFNEEYFRFKNYKYDTKIKWNAFKNYQVIDKNLFLDLEIGYKPSYILGEKEVGKDKFNEIVEFIKKKSKQFGKN